MVADYNCWEGEELQGRVKATILRGTPLVLDGAWVGPATGGEFLHRTIDPRISGGGTGGPGPDLRWTREGAGGGAA